MAKSRGDRQHVVVELLVVVRPGGAVPELEVVARADHGDLLRQPRVLHQEARDHHAAGGVELSGHRVRREVELQLAGLLRERVHALQGGHAEGLVVRGLPERDAPLDALRQHEPGAEVRPEAGRNREPVLRVE